MIPKGLADEKEYIALLTKGGTGLLYQKVGLCYLHSQEPPSSRPLIDKFTRKATAALRKSKMNPIAFGGFYACPCGKAHSASTDFILPDGTLTNSLLIHYLAMHREEVDLKDLATIERFDSGAEEPTEEEIFPSVITFNYIHDFAE